MNLLDNLYKRPKRDKGLNMPSHQVFEKDGTHQADLLFLPDDKGYKYALVVVDIATGLTDAEPLKNKNAESIIKAFKNIYSRKILSHPFRLEVDDGSEFKGKSKEYFASRKIWVRYAVPGRHRQQAKVERRNQTIGTELLKRQIAQELLTGEEDRQWVEDLPKVINNINKKTKPKKLNPNASPVCSGNSCDLLEEGTKVRKALDNPINIITRKPLPGKFRAGDVKYDPKPKTITQILLNPNKPPMYLLDNDKSAAYTRNQLQIIPKGEKPPDKSLLRGKVDKWAVKELQGRIKKDGKIYYKVQWVADDEITMEPRAELMKYIPKQIEEYEKKH